MYIYMYVVMSWAVLSGEVPTVDWQLCARINVVMPKDHYRNISFSAYIEYDFLDCTGTFAENVLRICSHFMLIFLCPCCLCSRSLCTSLCGGENLLFSTQSNKKSVNLGTLPVFFYHQTPCDLFSYLFVWKHERIYMEEIW